jgi:hypothetical protein
VVRPPPGGQARSLELCLDTLGDRRRRPRSHFSPVDMGVATIGHDQNPRARCAQLANASAAGAARGGVAAAFERRVPGDVLITRRSLHSRDLARWFARAQSVRTRYPSPRSDDFGAAMMGLADATMYIAILGSIGWKPLAVTTSFHINFLKKPAARALDAECRLLKLGKRLAVGEIWVHSEGEGDPVAHASATYSIPDHSTLSDGAIEPSS